MSIYRNSINFITIIIATSLLVGGCGSAEYVNGTDSQSEISLSTQSTDSEKDDSSAVSQTESTQNSTPASSGPGSRDNTPFCLVPEASGTLVYGNELVTIDASNTSQGYVCVSYTGSNPKVKMQITCPSTTVYTYRLNGGVEVFPLTTDVGIYSFAIFECISDNQYSTAFKQDINVDFVDQFGPYLYPNQYVNFLSDSACVEKGKELAYTANDDLEVVSNVYNYVINNIKYDAAFASTVESGYVPNPDSTLQSGKGICLDYASLMTSMLRSQRIPTHMEVGYAGTAYHAWISVYLEETGWVNGIIEFNGTTWELMDPTFAASSNEKELKKFIGDGSNYETKFIY